MVQITILIKKYTIKIQKFRQQCYKLRTLQGYLIETYGGYVTTL